MPVDISLCVMVMGQPECYNYNECNNVTSLKSLLPDNLICPRLRQNAVMKYRGSWAELNYERLISVLYKKVFYEDWCLAALDSVERLDKLSLLYPLLSSFHLNNWAHSVVLTQLGGSYPPPTTGSYTVRPVSIGDKNKISNTKNSFSRERFSTWS